ncbi:MAG: hypothetical protein FJX23_05965 [Alphaproteobacteria bacterium]|nr:hypothetical protein [Alphaproteobacteria bacterium]
MLFKKKPEDTPPPPPERYAFAIRTSRRLTSEEKQHLSAKEIQYMGGNHTFLALIDYQTGIVNEYGFGPNRNSATYFPTKGHTHTAQYRQNQGMDMRYADEIRYDISKEEYAVLKADLSSAQPKTYNLLSYNCTSWSFELAENHGFEVPQTRMATPSPNGLAKALKRLSEAAPEQPEPPEGGRKSHVETLKSRLQQSGRMR